MIIQVFHDDSLDITNYTVENAFPFPARKPINSNRFILSLRKRHSTLIMSKGTIFSSDAHAKYCHDDEQTTLH